MTLVFRNQLSQTATQIRTLLATPPEEWHAEAETRATLALLDLEDQIAMNAEYSESLLNEAARFEDGQRLFLSAFGKLPAASKDAEEKAYDDLLNDIRIDDLHAASRQMVGTISRRIRTYKRQAAELRAQIAQEQTRATIDFTLEEHANREGSVLRDILQNMQSQQMLQTQQMVQTMQDMMQTLTLPQQTAATTPVSPVVTSTPTVSAVFPAPAGPQHTAATVGTLQANANHLFPSTPVSVLSAPGGPFPVSTATVTMPIYTTGNMGAHSTFTPHSSHLTTPTGAGFGGQRQAPQYFSSPFVTQMQTSAVPYAFATPSRFHLPLPTLAIPHFSGERSKWRPFWHMFELMTQNHPELSDLEKHTLLLTYLKGDAMKLIDGIPLSHGNFHIVIDILKKRYDNRPQLITDLYSQLQKLEQASSLAKLKDLYFGFVRICRQLEVEGESPNHSPILWKMVYDKLSTQYLNKLLAKEPPGANWTALSIQGALWEVIEREEKLAEHRAEHGTDRPTKDKSDKSKPESNRSHHHTVLSAVADQKKAEPQWACSFCQIKGHWPDDCRTYPDHETRVARARELRYCFKCLRRGHSSKKCTKNPNCFFCKGNHMSALCREKFEQKSKKKAVNTIVAKEQEEEDYETLDVEPGTKLVSPAPLSVSSCNKQSELTLFMAAEAQIFNPEDPSKRIKALMTLDTHSHITVISEDFYKRLALTVDKRVQLSVSPFGDGEPIRFNTNKVRFGIQLLNRKEAIINGYTKKTVTVPVPIAVMKQEDVKNLASKGFPIQFRSPDILIGIDNFHAFQVQSGNPLPSGFHLSASKLGPLVSGTGTHPSARMSNVTKAPIQISSVIEVDQSEENQTHQKLEKIVTDHFALDSAEIDDDSGKSDEQIHQEFQNALTFSDGRYQVCLPKKDDVLKKLPSNYALALGRLQSLFKSLRKRPKILEEYNRVIREQLDRGMIEIVAKDEKPQGKVHYLPHQAVIRDDKETTKVRVVYDASAKTRPHHPSLNDALHRGPVLLRDLIGMIVRFRLPKVAIASDIEKAFLHLLINMADRDLLRFLWLRDISKDPTPDNIVVIRFLVVVFGLICSPFLLAATIREHLRRINSPLALHIDENHYVDDVHLLAQNPEEGYKMCLEAKQIFKEAGMNLRSFNSNAKDILTRLDPSDVGQGQFHKVLGIKWDTENDEFHFSLPTKLGGEPTKTSVLSTVAGIYDPIGFLSPVLLPAKTFFQTLWTHEPKLDWTTPLPKTKTEEWCSVIENWNLEGPIRIPRRTLPRFEHKSYELHIFSDASSYAYAAVAYLRTLGNDQAHSSLIFSKSRVKPTSGTRLTIPRLEMLGLVLGTRVLKLVKQELKLPITCTTIWTDSECVLHWISGSETSDRVISNKLKKIREHIGVTVKYVNTKENPADVATRGVTASELVNHPLWWNGPKWLQQPNDDNFPEGLSHEITETDGYHKEDQPSFLTLSIIKQDSPFMLDPSRFSSWWKFRRSTAYVLKFLKLCSKGRKFNNPILEESSKDLGQPKILSLAEALIFQEAQRRTPPSEHTEQNLGLTSDKFGLLRVKTRLGKAKIGNETKWPIFLAATDLVASLYVKAIHSFIHHAGPGMTLANVRRQVWIPQGRRYVSNLIRNCVSCKRFTAKAYREEPMPDLPANRVNPARPFEHISVDYFGPVKIRAGQEHKKVWVALFTCLAVRAIHLEVVSDISAEGFLHAFRRFIARFGTPKTCTSDHGTNFVGGSKAIEEAWISIYRDQSIQSYVADHGVKWFFVTEKAPWRAGYHERLIALVKHSLRRCIGRSLVNEKDFTTLLIEVEAVLNARPLTYQSESVDDLRALTPADFLHPGTTPIKTGVPILGEDGTEPYMPKSNPQANLMLLWERSLRRLDAFWNQWQEEYLLSLRERQEKLYRNRIDKTPTVGDLVLIHDENLPRGSWTMARVIELIPSSSDGLIREVKVKTAAGTLNRAPRHLYPLETSGEANVTPLRCEPTMVQQQPPPKTQAKHQMLLRPRKNQKRCSNCSSSPCLCAGNQPVFIHDSAEMPMAPQQLHNAKDPTPDPAQCQAEPDASESAAADSNDEVPKPQKPETKLRTPGVSRAEPRNMPKINH